VPAPVSLTPSRFTALGRDHARRRDLALIALSTLVVGASYFATSGSSALATGATSAVATAMGLYGRLAMGRWRSAAEIVAAAMLVAVLGGPPR
jgi:hypothetical protein